MLIAVTGALGFIGQEVISRLISTVTNRVIAVDFLSDVIARYEKQRFPILETVYENISRCESFMHPQEFLYWLKSSGSELGCVVHLGACVDTMDYGTEQLFAQNVDYTRELVDACNGNRQTDSIPGIVFASSAAVYGKKGFPANPYGLSKSIGEKFVSASRGRYVSLRFFNVFGLHEEHKGNMASVPFKLYRAYREGQKFNMHSLDSMRDFVPVSTVARSVVDFADDLANTKKTWRDEHLKVGGFDLGTGEATSFTDLDTYIMHAVGATSSCVRQVEMPRDLDGRYQTFTCAGSRGIANVGAGSESTRESIERIYGH